MRLACSRRAGSDLMSLALPAMSICAQRGAMTPVSAMALVVQPPRNDRSPVPNAPSIEIAAPASCAARAADSLLFVAASVSASASSSLAKSPAPPVAEATSERLVEPYLVGDRTSSSPARAGCRADPPILHPSRSRLILRQVWLHRSPPFARRPEHRQSALRGSLCTKLEKLPHLNPTIGFES